MEIKAITFDLWDTVIQDDSDEAERKRRGLRSKRDERRYLFWNAVNEVQEIDKPIVDTAYDQTEEEFHLEWYEHYRTWPIREHMNRVLMKINRSVPDDAFEQVARTLENMEIEIPPLPVDGIKEVLESLSDRCRLGVVSDTIVTPGYKLREWLELFDLQSYFSGFAFSDEVGHSKPHKDMFWTAANQLGSDLTNMVHIGDREAKDIQGAHAVGMKAILFTGSRDTDAENTTADAVIRDYSELLAALERIESEAA